MEKNKINYLVDLLLILFLIVTSITALILFFFLPSGVKHGRYQTFMGITKGNYITIHNLFGLVFIILMFIHVILHWRWIFLTSKTFFKKEKT